MSKFTLEKPALTFGGVFYPRDWVVLMFGTATDAAQVAADLKSGGYADEDLLVVDPATILANISATVGSAESGMPSVGAEKSMVRRHEALARQGHAAVMAYAPSETETERVMTVARRSSFSFAQKYHRFAIEDLS
ncbi:MAG: RNA-binding protein [Comamonadaceae bacterium]|nr:MAG: RNA-binding protein [Comamonadaceae bacterium]